MSNSHSFLHPPVWDDVTLDTERRRARDRFVDERMAELLAGNTRYRAVFVENLSSVQVLFAATDDLLDFPTGAALASNPSLMRAARYLGGPPVSADDLNTLVQEKVASRKRLSGDLAERSARVIEKALDTERFSWLVGVSPRPPTAEERNAAMRWTAGLMTDQQVQTARRTDSSKRQEGAVRSLLTALGFDRMSPARIGEVSDLPVGSFSPERMVAGSKCDIPVRLQDGRLLLIECKVSNTEINSVKRLDRECGDKAACWSGSFGDQAIIGVVLAGVYRLDNLRKAQATNHITIFWEHDLTPLATFLQSAV